MQSLPNIEKSAFRHGEYVGYSHGVWRITRGGIGWRAMHRDTCQTIYARTLAELSTKLAALKA